MLLVEGARYLRREEELAPLPQSFVGRFYLLLAVVNKRKYNNDGNGGRGNGKRKKEKNKEKGDTTSTAKIA
jgi:hypothetical protein